MASKGYHARFYANIILVLKDRIIKASNTPTKSHLEIPQDMFGVSRNTYAKEDLALVWLTISDILNNANKYRHGCTEAHWSSVVVSPLLHLVRRLKRHCKKAETKSEVLDMFVSQLTMLPIYFVILTHVSL